jgi:hypothetical protein
MPLELEVSKPCPKCGAARQISEEYFGLPGYIDPKFRKEAGEHISVRKVAPVRVVLCPKCSFIELYLDRG